MKFAEPPQLPVLHSMSQALLPQTMVESWHEPKPVHAILQGPAPQVRAAPLSHVPVPLQAISQVPLPQLIDSSQAPMPAQVISQLVA